MKIYRLFASGYTGGQPGQGAALLELSGAGLQKLYGWEGLVNPSYLLPEKDCLYAVEEQEARAAVVRLPLFSQEIQRFWVPGAGLCHLCSQGGYLYASGYAGGTLTGLDPETGEVCAFYQHQGCGPDPLRQEKAHVHSALPSPDGRELLVADLGQDRLFRYCLDSQGGLSPNPVQPWTAAAPGQGPRHLAFHPGGRWLYLVNELKKTLYVFRYQGADQKLAFVEEQDISQPETAGSLAADVHFTPDGARLYASVRGTDRIFCFNWREDGCLEPAGDFSSGGQGPRSFHISPDGQFLAAANQVSGTIAVFALNRATGALGEKTAELAFPAASCVKFAG